MTFFDTAEVYWQFTHVKKGNHFLLFFLLTVRPTHPHIAKAES